MVLSLEEYNNIYNFHEKLIEPKFYNYIQLSWCTNSSIEGYRWV